MGKGYVVHASMTIQPNRAIIRSFGVKCGGIIDDARKTLFDYDDLNVRAGIPLDQLRSAMDEKYHSQILVGSLLILTDLILLYLHLDRRYVWLKCFSVLSE